jgi:hypothetical protein
MLVLTTADNGSITWWDYKTGLPFQTMTDVPQPGSLDAEAGIFCSTFDQTGSRLITGGADKTIKVRLAFPRCREYESWEVEEIRGADDVRHARRSTERLYKHGEEGMGDQGGGCIVLRTSKTEEPVSSPFAREPAPPSWSLRIRAAVLTLGLVMKDQRSSLNSLRPTHLRRASPPHSH